MIGTRFGNWKLLEELGRGPSGTVYRAQAFELRPHEPPFAAVKVLDAAMCRDAAFVERFPGEMLSLHRLVHPNLARFYDSGVQAGLLYYASEFATGTDLASNKGTPLDWAEAVHAIAVQAARALKHAHHRSILHRDLKPANFIVAPDGSLKVTDFGVAKFFNVPPLALPAEPMGSACYLAPEHFTGKPLTRRSDLYALGGVLYTLVCGRPPFQAATTAEYMHKHCYMLPDRPQSFVPKLPMEVDDLICSLLMKDPARRPASAAAVLEELERLRGKLERKGDRVSPPPLADDPTGLHAPLSVTTSPVQESQNDAGRRRERFVRGAVLGLAFCVVLGLILFAFLRPRPSAEALWTQAQPLLASDNPEDWDRAREDYLDRIERWHRGAYAAEIEAVRHKVQDRRELKRAATAGTQVKPTREAERLYRRGLAQLSQGDSTAARATWSAVVQAFKSNGDDARWVMMAEAGLTLEPQPGERPDARAAVAAILETTKAMPTADAAAMLAALRSLYHDRPEILEMLK